MLSKKVERMEGPNDGLVSVESQKWGQHIKTVNGILLSSVLFSLSLSALIPAANHLEEINWYVVPNANFDAFTDLWIHVLTVLVENDL
jgi:hypothetical protein